MCDLDLDPCDVWRETPRKARKAHRCTECRGEIQPGQTYVVHFSVFEGDPTTAKICEACERDRREFARVHEGTLCTPGGFSGLLESCLEDDPEAEDAWRPMLARIEASRAAYREANKQPQP